MKYYELTYLISPEVSKEGVKAIQEKINSLIEKEGEILKELTPLAKKKLAFPIKKQTEAFLASIDFWLKPEGLKGLEKELKTEKKILRYLILTKKMREIKPEKKPPKEIVRIPFKEKKVELKEIEKKLEEILGE